MLNKMKDLTLAKTAKIAINSQIEKYGKVTELSLNSKSKSLSLSLALKGETSELEISIERYILSQKNDTYSIQVQGIQTSRIWLSALSKEYIENKNFKIPSKYMKVLKNLI